MKNVIVISIFLAVITNSFAQKEPATEGKAGVGFDVETNAPIKELFYVLSSDKVTKHGIYRAYTIKDTLFIVGNYQKGKKNGRWKYRYSTAPFAWRKEGDFQNDMKTGKWIFYHNVAGNRIKETYVYSNNEASAYVERYGNAGNIEAKGNAENKKGTFCEVGSWTFLHSNGQKMSEGNFVFDGISKSVKTGEWKYWYENGKPSSSEIYNSAGKLHGIKPYFSRNGELEKREFYNNGNLEKTEDKFTFQKREIDSILAKSDEYKTHFSAVCEGEINDVREEIAAYELAKKDSERFKKGNQIIEHLKTIYQNFQPVKNQHFTIDSLQKIVNESFAKNYSELQQNDIFPVNEEFKNFQKTGNISQRLEKGKNILEKFNFLSKSFSELQEFSKNISQTFPSIEKYYQDSFPSIYQNEIVVFKQRIDKYKISNTLQEKLREGKEISDKINFLSQSKEEISKIDKEMKSRRSAIQIYKKNYPAIYDNIKPLIDQAFAKYSEINTVEEKLSVVKSLGTFLKKYEDDYAKLESQDKTINEKYQEFVQKLKPDKKNKFIYKRGVTLFEMYNEARNKRATTNTRLAAGTKTIELLDKLLSFHGKENPDINEKLKKAQTAKEFAEILGLQID